MSRLRVGILGAGNIANSMAQAVTGLKEEACCYAIASRSSEKSEKFAKKWGFEKAYGSYEELLSDPDVDLVYVATPHNSHYQWAKACIEHGKPALVEKPFTVNEAQAKEIFDLAKEKNVFITEATWTRFLPGRFLIKELMESGCIGKITSQESYFTTNASHVQRMYDPELAGGALLDLGIYNLTFASMYFGEDVVKVESSCEKYETGVDATDEITYTYADGKTAYMRTSFVEEFRHYGVIRGTKGRIHVEGLTNPSAVRVLDLNGNPVKEVPIPPQINGYEYEVLSCKKALEEGKTECPELPHETTLLMMRRMDELRRAWGVTYPFE